MKKICIKVIAFIFVMPLLFLSGCFYFDENNPDAQLSGIEGYKVCYSDNDYEIDDTFAVYSELILKELYSNFGILNDETNSSAITNSASSTVASNYDKIRVQTLESGTTTEIPWNWTFSTETQDINSLENNNTAVEVYSNTTAQTKYYDAFVNKYKVALEIVLMQIVMDEELTDFTIVINNSSGTTNVFFDTEMNQEITNEDCTALTETKQDFAENGNYVGLTSEDVQTLKTYILTNIIGEAIIDTLYDTVDVNGQTKDYEYIIDQILTVSPDLPKSIFDPYPTSTIKDYTDSSLYISTSSTDALSHIQALEYQSIVIMPNASGKFYMIELALEAEYEVDITVKVNYFDKNTSIYSTIATEVAHLTGNKWSFEDSVGLSFENYVDVEAFDNSNQILSASEPKTVSNENDNSVLYSINSENVGVLNYQEMTQSYFEIVFEVGTDNSKTYWPFKAGISLIW